MDARYQRNKAIVGIDYGSKLAGTTALCIRSEAGLAIHQSQKKKDADAFVIQTVKDLRPGVIALDAPLSLPGVYTATAHCNDYHYRNCDRTLKAMSPMFLGGLTARAMKLASQLQKLGWDVIETYPAAFIRSLLPHSAYAKTKPATIPEVTLELQASFSKLLAGNSLPKAENYHQLDSQLAFISACRYHEELATAIGTYDGKIWL